MSGSLNINGNNINLFQNTSINKIAKSPKINNDSDEKADKSNLSINLKQKNKQSDLMENLLKQKQSFNEQKQTLIAKDMDPKEKKYKLEEVNKNIQEMEAQIQQLAIQEKQEEIEKQQEKISKQKAVEEKYNKNDDEVRDDIIISASLNELIKFSSSKDNIHLLKDGKNRQIIEAEYIKPNDNPNSYNNKRLAQISKSISNINSTINKNIRDVNKGAERIKAKTELAIEQIKNQEENTENIETQDKEKVKSKTKESKEKL
ncbi:hypothetical protein [Clostridium uliginosum]|uniref:Viral A-type inclusion protein n=1 Tax=Clostridium uliginosum TaxID=119641 RepID=A0A1I1Q6E4_9CLOT|nr:hypothetical protein [Clostridium uliginosum]SFD17542.1 hypothetical protein SAMN05421842_12347 [Clostridium uliginosum]